MASEVEVCPAAELPPGPVTGAGQYAVGNVDGRYFAVTRRCRHLLADLANGSITELEFWPQGRVPGGSPRYAVLRCVGDVAHLGDLISDL